MKLSQQKIFVINWKIYKTKNFLFYLNCIPEILKLDNELYFLFIGKGEQEKKLRNFQNN